MQKIPEKVVLQSGRNGLSYNNLKFSSLKSSVAETDCSFATRAGSDPKKRDKFGRTPLLMASYGGYVEVGKHINYNCSAKISAHINPSVPRVQKIKIRKLALTDFCWLCL